MNSGSGPWTACILLAPLVAGGAQELAPRPARARLDLTPFALEHEGPFLPRPELQPVLAGDKVLVTTTLRLFAFAASTGELRWSAGPPAGWDALEGEHLRRLVDGIDSVNLCVAPAAGARVAVAALQLSFARDMDDSWQGIQIVRSLPERRLFAFDLESGRPLWNHAPPPAWNPAEGPFQERMTVLAPPLVAGERVLVACASDAAKVDYHVACYALSTGKLLWSTLVVEGLVERNMFGRAVREFAAAPLALATPKRVLAQTGLGVVAALELDTGTVAWRAEYEPLPLPKTRSYQAPLRVTTWRRAPPLVAGDVVLATPSDGAELLALDLGDGHRLWSVAAKPLVPEDERAFDHLIGVRDATFYLGGARVGAFRKAEGLRSAAALEPLWSATVSEAQSRSTRIQLAGERLFVPRSQECLVLERGSGAVLAPLPLADLRGLCVADEVVFALTPAGLQRLAR